MSALRRQRQAELAEAEGAGGGGGSGTGGVRGRLLRVLEVALWLVVVVLFAARVAPQLGAALGWRGTTTAEPPVTFAMLDGGALPLGSLKGKVVLVNFWATWCPPCRAEMPGFEEEYTKRQADGFTVVGVSMDQAPPSVVASFVRDHGITYPVALGTDAVVAGFGGVNAFPTSFLIDRRGRVRYTVEGIFAPVTLKAAVDRLLAERG